MVKNIFLLPIFFIGCLCFLGQMIYKFRPSKDQKYLLRFCNIPYFLNHYHKDKIHQDIFADEKVCNSSLR
jgi:hypothetical protein